MIGKPPARQQKITPPFATVRRYRVDGYQVLKNWFSYRERSIIGPNLKPDETQYFTDARRRMFGRLSVPREGTENE